jgi:hypothetical protein
MMYILSQNNSFQFKDLFKVDIKHTYNTSFKMDNHSDAVIPSRPTQYNVQRRSRQFKKANTIQGQHNTMSNADAVNPRRPTQYNVQRRRRQSKKANTIQCSTETPSIQEGQHNTMSNVDAVNPRRPTYYYVQRRRRQSK